MDRGERFRNKTPFGPLRRTARPLSLLKSAKKALTCSEIGDPKESLIDSSYWICVLQNRLQNREEILLSKEAKTRGYFKEYMSRSA